jgi:hypothetical protein
MDQASLRDFPEAGQSQGQTSLANQKRKVTKAKGGSKYSTQIPCILRLAMLAPVQYRRVYSCAD